MVSTYDILPSHNLPDNLVPGIVGSPENFMVSVLIFDQ